MCFGAACLASLFFLWVGLFKPKFYWQSPQGINLRRRLGDRPTQMLLLAIGAALMAVLFATYGGVFMGAQLMYGAIFGLAVFIGFKAVRWFRRPKPSRQDVELQRQRQQLTRLLRQ